MDFGLKLKQRARAKPRRRPTGQPAPRAISGQPKKREGAPPSRWSLIGDAVHGVVFVGLAIASFLYFGQSFEVVAAIVAALGILSLREVWIGLQAHKGELSPDK